MRSRALAQAFRIGRRLKLSALNDRHVRAYLFFRPLQDMPPDVQVKMACAAGFTGRTPYAALRMQHNKVDQTLHCVVAALLARPHATQGCEPRDEAKLRESARTVLCIRQLLRFPSPQHAELFALWCTGETGHKAYQTLKRQLKLTASRSYGCFLLGAKHELLQAVEAALDERSPPTDTDIKSKTSGLLQSCDDGGSQHQRDSFSSDSEPE